MGKKVLEGYSEYTSLSKEHETIYLIYYVYSKTSMRSKSL